MGYTPIESTTGTVIALLNDKPNDVEGMSATDLKAAFDQAGNKIVKFINETLIPELENNSEDNIVIEAGDVLSRDMTLKEVVYYLAASLNNKISVQIPDRSISNGKIATKSITNAEIRDDTIVNSLMTKDSVNTNNIVDLAVSTGKLANGAVTTLKIDDGAVTDAKIASIASSKISGNIATTKLSGTITNDQLAGSIESGKIKDLAISTTKLADSAVTTAKIATGQIHKEGTCSLASGKTSWTVSVDSSYGVTASTPTIVSPANDSSWTEWVNKGVRLSSKTTNSLTFAARTKTEAAITVNFINFIR